MRTLLTLILGLCLALPAVGQQAAAVGSGDAQPEAQADPVARWQADPTQFFDASEVELSEFHWIARPVVVFSDSPNNPNFVRQIELLRDHSSALVERDVVVILDSDPGSDSGLRRRLRPRGFMLALLGKDGDVKLRKPFPWDVREISRSIDKRELRQQEIRERNKRGD